VNFATMASVRQEKFNSLLQQDLGEIFQQNSGLFKGQFITVSGVSASPDLGYVKVYLSFLNVKDKEALLELIDFHKKEIRHQLAKRIRNQVRKVPELEFFIDDSLDEVFRMDKIFNSLNKAKKDDDNKE
jgi:ribosome-binding factor A